MAKIHTIKIKNFRGLENFEHCFGFTDFVCLIGRGDSGKTTLLEAISAVLSPSWNRTFFDTDFFNTDTSKQIEIIVTLYDLPKILLTENKFGLYKQGMDKDTGIIHDDLIDGLIDVLSIKLVVTGNLEPKWYVINGRGSQEDISIGATDRSKLSVFYVSDYIDSHFTWKKGTPLYSMLRESGEQTEDPDNTIFDAIRKAKAQIDAASFDYLNTTVDRIKLSARSLGIDAESASTSVDFRDFTVSDGKICLHDGNIPFRLKGKGTKRLLSIAIQLELTKSGGIVLIDELEQGLEPDRVKHLARTLRNHHSGQIFITTHSRDVLVELEAASLFRIKNDTKKVYPFDKSMQGVIRACPEAFFSDKVIVCEGATESGFVRAIDHYRISISLPSAVERRTSFTDGRGSNQIDYAKGFVNAGYKVSLLCDSDVEAINIQKPILAAHGVEIIDCTTLKSIENHLFEDLPWETITELIMYRISETDIASVTQSVKAKFEGEFTEEDWWTMDSPELRNALSDASSSKHSPWFKRLDHGQKVGEICCSHLDLIPQDKKLRMIIEDVIKWIDNE